VSALSYPVTQNYGYDPSYPTADHFHKGIDYGCPMQTPVIVNGVQIGLSGNSGFVTGPHLHVGRWIGSVHTNPGVGNGFNFGDAVVTEINEDATNGKYVRVQADGASWVYLHLFEQTCSVGQRLTPAVPQAPAPLSSESHVHLPANVDTWAVYHVGSGLRKGTADQIGTLLPSKYGGLTYAIKRWVGDYAVVIDTESYGEVTLWVKNTDAQFNNGAPAPAPPPPPAPVAPPPPPPPAAPLSAPSSETYDLIKELDGYLTSNQAINHISPQVKIAEGTYFVFNKRFNNNDSKQALLAINVTKIPGKPGAWINAADNTPDAPAPPAAPEPEQAPAPAPEPVAVSLPTGISYKEFAKAQKYLVTADVSVYDLNNGDVVAVYHKFDEVWIEGAIKSSGVAYARLQTEAQGEWLAIRVYSQTTNLPNLELYEKVYSNTTTIPERETTKTMDLIDHFALGYSHLKKNILGFLALFSKMKSEQKK
jgi:hypothetical protein